MERDTICNIIDSIFGCDAPDASQEVKAKELTALPKPFRLPERVRRKLKEDLYFFQT